MKAWPTPPAPEGGQRVGKMDVELENEIVEWTRWVYMGNGSLTKL